MVEPLDRWKAVRMVVVKESWKVAKSVDKTAVSMVQWMVVMKAGCLVASKDEMKVVLTVTSKVMTTVDKLVP